MDSKLHNKNGSFSKRKVRSFLEKSILGESLLKAFFGEFKQLLFSVYLLFRKKLTKQEAKTFVKEVTGGKVKYIERNLGEKNAYIKHINKTNSTIIVCDPKFRYRAVIAHELGHYVSSQKLNTYNYKTFLKRKKGDYSIGVDEVYLMELEAWKEAEKLSKKNTEFKALKNIGLNHYKSYAGKGLNNKHLSKYKLKQTVVGLLTGLLTLVFLRNKNYNKKTKALIFFISASLGGYLTRKIYKDDTVNKIIKNE